jgi:hypothetical protein
MVTLHGLSWAKSSTLPVCAIQPYLLALTATGGLHVTLI